MRVIPVSVAEPTTEPVTLAQIAGQVRAEGGDGETAMLMGYLVAARQQVENVLGFPVSSRAVRATFYHWPDQCWGDWPMRQRDIEIGMPVNSIDAIAYTAADGTTQPWVAGPTGYVARVSPGKVTHIRPAYGLDWPILGNDPVITLDATAGWDRTPEAIIQAICLLAAHFFLNREEVLTGARIAAVQLPMGVADLLAPYRWRLVG